jgi:ribosomal protein S27AE
MLSALERKNTDILLRMWNDPATEWRRLTEHYKSLCDEELLELGADMADLTEVAQQVLRDEMKTRGLSESEIRPVAAESVNSMQSAAINWEPPSYRYAGECVDEDAGKSDGPCEYSWKTLLCQCETLEQAKQLAEALRRQAIECWIDKWTHSAMDMNGPRVLVAADQLEQARTVASQPIPQDIIDETRQDLDPAPTFEMPSCPKCGAQDPLLESADPTNQWRCGACGRQWVETESASAAGGRE